MAVSCGDSGTTNCQPSRLFLMEAASRWKFFVAPSKNVRKLLRKNVISKSNQINHSLLRGTFWISNNPADEGKTMWKDKHSFMHVFFSLRFIQILSRDTLILNNYWLSKPMVLYWALSKPCWDGPLIVILCLKLSRFESVIVERQYLTLYDIW